MKYSIITINYNNCDGLRKTIESVVNQTCTDYEYIVIDGGSTDGSVDVIKEYADKIDYWVSEPDKGIYNAMNKGILQAHGDYLNFMNSGDRFYDDNVLLNISSHLTTDIVYGKCYSEAKNKYYYKEASALSMMDFYSDTLTQQAIFTKKALFNNNKFDEEYTIVADWIFLVNEIIFNNCSISSVPILITKYEGGGLSDLNVKLLFEEKNKYLSQILPPKIIADYEKYKDKESPILYLIPSFNRTRGFHTFIYNIVKFMIKIYNTFR